MLFRLTSPRPLLVTVVTVVAAALATVAGPAQAQVPARAAAATAVTGHDRPITISRAVRTAASIRIDGRLDEAAWQAAPVTDSFTQIQPQEGEPSTQRTEVRVLYDDAALYVGARLHDTGPITARLGRRDMPLSDSDWFGVMIDSYHDHRTAFGFDVNPAGVRRDEVKTIDVDDNSWDPVWEVVTTVDSAGWTAEYRIPFSQLRFSNAPEQLWGVQFERLIGRLNEYSVSTFIPQSERGGVPRYGHLEGVRDVKAGKRVELLPYVVQRAEYVDQGENPFRTDHDRFTSAGLDALVRLSSNLTLNATLNPDFGQVEVDPAVVNLGVYEVFFAERRPFFIEGSEIFAFGADGTSGGQLFYSRRIGRTPSLAAPTAASDAPSVTTILGAAKLSGKVAGWSVGVLEAVTEREEARFLAPGSGAHSEMTVEPMTNYLVGRARRELRSGQTFLGGVVTATNRRLDDDQLRNVLRGAGYAAGLDFRHEWGRRSWVLQGDAEVSRVTGTASAITRTQQQSNHFFQRPDGDHLPYDTTATSLEGYSMNVSLAKQAGTHWRGRVAGAITSPGYEVNDLGFSRRTDRRDVEASLQYVENRPGSVFQRWNTWISGRSEHNFAGDAILSIATVSAFAQTRDFWGISGGVTRFFRAYDDRLTRGGPLARRPAWTVYFAGLSSDVRRAVTLNTGVHADRHESGAWTNNLQLQVGIKSSTRWNASFGPTIMRAHNPAQWVTSVRDSSYAPTYGRRYLFAPLDQTEVALETRLNVTFTPRLSLETFVQPLLSSGDFGGARSLVAPRTFDFVPYGGTVPALDFNVRSLRGNAVLRWEWRQGSTMFVAWQQTRSDFAPLGDFDFGRDRRALFGTAPDNIFLVKVNFWVNP